MLEQGGGERKGVGEASGTGYKEKRSHVLLLRRRVRAVNSQQLTGNRREPVVSPGAVCCARGVQTRDVAGSPDLPQAGYLDAEAIGSVKIRVDCQGRYWPGTHYPLSTAFYLKALTPGHPWW